MGTETEERIEAKTTKNRENGVKKQGEIERTNVHVRVYIYIVNKRKEKTHVDIDNILNDMINISATRCNLMTYHQPLHLTIDRIKHK